MALTKLTDVDTSENFQPGIYAQGQQEIKVSVFSINHK